MDNENYIEIISKDTQSNAGLDVYCTFENGLELFIPYHEIVAGYSIEEGKE